MVFISYLHSCWKREDFVKHGLWFDKLLNIGKNVRACWPAQKHLWPFLLFIWQLTRDQQWCIIRQIKLAKKMYLSIKLLEIICIHVKMVKRHFIPGQLVLLMQWGISSCCLLPVFILLRWHLWFLMSIFYPRHYICAFYFFYHYFVCLSTLITS